MDIFFIVLGVLAVASVAATGKDLLLDGYRARPVDPDRLRPDQEIVDRKEREITRARRAPRLHAPRHPRSLG